MLFRGISPRIQDKIGIFDVNGIVQETSFVYSCIGYSVLSVESCRGLHIGALKRAGKIS